MHSTAKEREAVMTDDGSQPPIKQLATAVHRGPATRSWCGPLLLVLVDGIVVVVLTLTHGYNAVRGHRTGSNNSGAENYLRRKTNKNRRSYTQ